MNMSGKSIPVKLPRKMLEEIDGLIKNGKYLSRSDLLRFGARLVLGIEKKRVSLHALAEEYAVEDIREKLNRTERGRNARR